MKSIDERFENIADRVSEAVGHWSLSALSIVLITAWTIFCALVAGPAWWYGQFYNFPLNQAMTIIELFLGFLMCSAANRVERRNRQLLDQQNIMLLNNTRMHERQLMLLEAVSALLKKEDISLKHIEDEIAHRHQEG